MVISQKRVKVDGSGNVAEVMRKIYENRNEEDKHKEMFYTIGLNSQNVILFIDLVSLGTVDRANPHIRECLRLAIIKNAISLIICHNHPSGNTTPSREDEDFTKELKAASRIVGVNLLDHIIVGEDYYSFADKRGM